MKKLTLTVDGMHCEKCSERVTNAIKNVENVKKVKTSLSDKNSVVIATDEVDETKLKSAVEELGFSVTGIVSEPYKKGFSLFKK